jgi:Bacterial regulatory protein, Fis family
MATLQPHPHPNPSDLEVLATWAPELADTFVALACDIALVVDAEGRIITLAQRDERPIAARSWVGRLWSQTVDADSRPKVEAMLADVAEHGVARRREINHRTSSRATGGGSQPVAYSAARLGAGGPTLAVGQDLRGQSALQQRFVAAQEALERSYWHAQRQLREPASTEGMTEQEKEALGLEPIHEPTTHDLDDSELVRALGRLVERIDHDTLPGLLRDARRLAEGHFIARALARAGSVDALARTLGVSRRSLVRRRKPQKL